MSWEEDKDVIIIFIALVLFIVFCLFMAVLSHKKQKKKLASGELTTEEITQNNAKKNQTFGYWVQIFFGIIWLMTALIIFYMYTTNSLTTSFVIPKFLRWIYDIFGITIGSLMQGALSLLLIFDGVKHLKNLKNK